MPARCATVDGWRWCLGVCERWLPAEAFELNVHGNPASRCRTCRRYDMRTRARNRYHRERAYRLKVRARRRRYYYRTKEAA